MPPRSERLNGTAVAIGPWAILLRGESGSGKSTLALQLIENHQAMLIGDDAVKAAVMPDGSGVMLSPAEGGEGLLEIRGLGITSWPYCRRAEARLVVELLPDSERLPEPAAFTLCSTELPLVRMCRPTPEALLQALRDALR